MLVFIAAFFAQNEAHAQIHQLFGDDACNVLNLHSLKPVDRTKIRDLIEQSQALSALCATDPQECFKRKDRDANPNFLLRRVVVSILHTNSQVDLLLPTLNQIAENIEVQGDWTKAVILKKCIRDLMILKFGKNSLETAQSRTYLGSILISTGRLAEAKEQIEIGLSIRKTLLPEFHPLLAESYMRLSEANRLEGSLAQALSFARRAVLIRESIVLPNDKETQMALSWTIMQLGAVRYDEGEYEDAESLFRRALAIWEAVGNPEFTDVPSNNLGNTLVKQGRYSEAAPLFRAALKARKITYGINHQYTAYSLDSLASVLYLQNSLEASRELFAQAVKIRRQTLGDHSFLTGITIAKYANVLRDLKQYSEAEKLYIESVSIFDKAGYKDHQRIASALNGLQTLYSLTARSAAAVPIVKRSLAIREAAPDVALPILYTEYLNDRSKHKNLFFDGFTIFQQSAASSAADAINKLAQRFSAGSGELASLVRADQDLSSKQAGLDKVLVAALSKPTTERDTATEGRIRSRIEEVVVGKAKIQSTLTARYPDYAELAKPESLSVQETQQLLYGDEALVAFSFTKEAGYVWVFTKEQAEWYSIDISRDQIIDEVKKLRSGLNPSSTQKFDRQRSYSLYKKLFSQIEGVIKEKDRLSFVLDGALSSLPPSVFISTDPKDKDDNSVDWLIRKYSVSILPSVTSLKTLREKQSVASASKSLIGFADPVFDLTSKNNKTEHQVAALALDPLPDTAAELIAVGNIVKADRRDLYIGVSATVPSVKAASLDQYRVVYFATHALVAGETDKFSKSKAEPAIVLSLPEKPTDENDGLLRASDVAQLKLNADIVVLSACNTAAGDKPSAEALSGLARAFFYAGARSVIASHWTVDSESAVLLMTRLFWQIQSKKSATYSEALQTSMLALIDDKWVDFSEPKYWAPFVVVGVSAKLH